MRVVLFIFLIPCFTQVAVAENVCVRLSQIKVLPFKGESGLDENYDAFIRAGRSAIPCLIGKIVDTTRMRDPRSEPGYQGIDVRVGDVAYFVLADIAKTPFIALLPARVQRDWQNEGVLAYFRFVQKRANRRWLQLRLRAWYRNSSLEKSQHNKRLQRTRR